MLGVFRDSAVCSAGEITERSVTPELRDKELEAGGERTGEGAEEKSLSSRQDCFSGLQVPTPMMGSSRS